MGNCLKPLEFEKCADSATDQVKHSKRKNSSRAQKLMRTSPVDQIENIVENYHNNAHAGPEDGNPRCLSTSSAPSPKCETTWRRLLHQTTMDSEQAQEQDECSIFGTSWDPELFDHRPSSPSKTDRINSIHGTVRRISKLRPGGWTRCASTESLVHQDGDKKHRLLVLPSTLLGFSPYPTSAGEPPLEWYRNGELEVPKLDTNNFLIKGKQRTYRKAGRTSGEKDASGRRTTDPLNAGCLFREGWLRYTIFIHQDKTDICQFQANFRTAKHVFLSLETKSGCEIRFSKRVFIYRGKLVRLCVIDGPSRRSIVRCYTSLPEILTKTIISESERPSLLEPQSALLNPAGPTRSLPSNFTPMPITV